MAMTPEQRARHYSGLLQNSLDAHRAGRLADAAKGYVEILGQFPNNAVTLDLYGTLLHQCGENRQAVALLERAAALGPSASVFNHLGAARRALDDRAGALDAFSRACAADQGYAEGWLNRTQLLEELGRLDDALDAIQAAARVLPGNAAVQARHGALLVKLDRSLEALAPLAEARRLDPLQLEPYLHGARALRRLDQSAAAEFLIRRAIVLAPATIEFYAHLTGTDSDGTAWLDYVAWAGRAVRVKPGDARLWANLASECSRADATAPAIAHYRRAMMLDPTGEAAHHGLGLVLHRAGRHPEARRACRYGLVVLPGLADLKLILGEIELALGNLPKGWALLEARLDPRLSPRRIGLPPLWDGKGDPGRLFVAAEQGIGDEYVFLSFLPRLIEKAERLVVECDGRNLALLRRSFPTISFIERQLRADEKGKALFDYSTWSGRGEIDRAVMAGSLPGLFIVDPSRPGPRGGYLAVDGAERQVWLSRFAALGRRPKVGIAWRSGLVNRRRSAFYCTASDLVRAIGPDRAEFVSLNYAVDPLELAAVEAELGCRIHVPLDIDQRDELDRVAALLSALDCVVGVGTAPTVLAAAVGTETIQLNWSRFHLADDHDVVFGNSHPTMRRGETFDIRLALARAGALFARLTSG